jgi:hypothetical protein
MGLFKNENRIGKVYDISDTVLFWKEFCLTNDII